MSSTDEFEQRRTFEDKPIISKENGWETITLADGKTYTYNKVFWDEFLYGDVSKLVTNKNK